MGILLKDIRRRFFPQKKGKKTKKSLSEIAATLGVLLSIVSIVSIGWHAYHFFKGSECAMIPVSQVLLFAKEYPDGETYLHAAARLSYLNRGAPGYNDAIFQERVSMDFNGTRYILKWENFVDISIMKEGWEMKIKENAHPITIEAGSSVSHMTTFIPQPCDQSTPPEREAHPTNICRDKWHNYLKWNDFCEYLKQSKPLTLSFCAETVSGESLTKPCTVTIAPGEFTAETAKQTLIVRSCCDATP